MTTGSAAPAAKLVWRLRYDLLAVVVVATTVTVSAERISLERFVPVVALTGIVVSIFIGFRLRNAYSTWLDAQRLWEAVGVNSRALMNALTIIDNRTTQMAVISDRMVRRQVRHVWELAAELRRAPPVPEVSMLTPEDPSLASAVELLTYQAADSRNLTRADLIDSKARGNFSANRWTMGSSDFRWTASAPVSLLICSVRIIRWCDMSQHQPVTLPRKEFRINDGAMAGDVAGVRAADFEKPLDAGRPRREIRARVDGGIGGLLDEVAAEEDRPLAGFGGRNQHGQIMVGVPASGMLDGHHPVPEVDPSVREDMVGDPQERYRRVDVVPVGAVSDCLSV